jgi:hypothetical protein
MNKFGGANFENEGAKHTRSPPPNCDYTKDPEILKTTVLIVT